MSTPRLLRTPQHKTRFADHDPPAVVPWTATQRRAIRERLLRWYDANCRKLPWRDSRDPYHIWLSEIMLQQTRVAAVVGYYQRFLEAFPTVQSLARAPQEKVLRLWAGLGYYSRARNLHAAAREITQTENGRIPSSVEALLKLPGVGRYTAGAIASIAFDQREAVVDGNIKRVLARLTALREPISTRRYQARLWVLAESLVPDRRPGDFNQALMELGATVCTPRVPVCDACPLRALCRAYHTKRVEDFPQRGGRPAKRHSQSAAIAIRSKGRYLFVQRPIAGLLGGFWGLPQFDDVPPDAEFSAVEKRVTDTLPLRISLERACGAVRHEFTHLSLTLCVYEAVLLRKRSAMDDPRMTPAARWLRLAEYETLPLSSLDRKILRLLHAAR